MIPVKTQVHEPGCQNGHLCLSCRAMGAVQLASYVCEGTYFLKPCRQGKGVSVREKGGGDYLSAESAGREVLLCRQKNAGHVVDPQGVTHFDKLMGKLN